VPRLLGTRCFGDEYRMNNEAGEDESKIAASGSLLLGKTVVDDDDVLLPVQAFRRHFMALGGSGSGKTVLCKCVIEEAVRNNVPVLIVDPQGDISSLAIKGDIEELMQHGAAAKVQEDFFGKARVAIFTPASNRAIPICVNPFKSPSHDVPQEEAILAIDLTADSLVGFLGYDLNGDARKSAKAYIFTILEYMWQHGQRISHMAQLADLILNPPENIAETLNGLVEKKEPEEIARKLRFLTVGTSSLLFQMGVQMDINLFIDNSDGKVPVNIIYLNTLTSENDKQFFLATLLKELYCWMLKNPSNDLRMLFYIDEISPYIPPYPRNPPPKNAYTLLFKQARKYGLGLVAATQNITDIDYKALAQVNTWCLGRMMTTQDIARVQKIIQSIDSAHAEAVLQKLPSLRTGEFLLLSPDLYSDVVDFDVRWLASKHLTLDEKDLAQYVPTETRAFFEKYVQTDITKKWATAAHFEPSKTLNERTQRFLRSEGKALPAALIARDLKVSREESEKVLASLVKAGIAKKGRNKTGGETLYWLSEFNLDPSRSISGEVLMISPAISQAEAVKKIGPLLEGGVFRKDEEVYDAEFRYAPIWMVKATKETRVLLIKKEETRTYYISAETGDLISLEKKQIVFHRLLSGTSQKLRNLDEDKRFVFVSKMPSEVDKLPQTRLSKEKACQTLGLKIGVTPVSAELVLLPIWSLKVQHKRKRAKRAINMDAATGRLLIGNV
jgi:hypothetical protein